MALDRRFSLGGKATEAILLGEDEEVDEPHMSTPGTLADISQSVDDPSELTLRSLDSKEQLVTPDASKDNVPRRKSSQKQTMRTTSGVVLFESPEDEKNCLTENPIFKGFFRPRWLLVCLCLYALIQSMEVTGLFAATISSIEQRYDVSSATMGLVASTYDLTVLSTAWIIAYYGGSVRGHTPRWLASGLLIIGIGGIMFASPQFFGGLYSPAITNDTTDYCTAFSFTPDCQGSASRMITVIFIAQVVIALGAAPLYTLGPSYFDEVIDKHHLPLYLGIFYMFAALGPALGFIVAGAFLNEWVDPGEQPPGITTHDPQWVGQWWTGYVIAGVLGIVLSIPLFMFPKFLPGSRHIRESNRREAAVLKRRLSMLLVPPDSPKLGAALMALAVNPTYFFNLLGQATEAFTVAGFSTFLPKIVQSMFGLTASEASFAVGLVIIPGAAGGIFTGGYLMKRFKLSGLKTARMCWIVALIAFFVMFGFYIGCDTVKLAGVTSVYPVNQAPLQYWGGINDNVNLTSTCNANCVCNPDIYEPVCGDGINFFSACYAGCLNKTGEHNDAVYSNCACLPPVGNVFPSVELGRCDTGCTALVPFLIMLFFAMFFTFLNNVPATTVILRCTQPEHRSLAMGVQNVTFRLLGSIPGPIIVGAIIDATCELKETDCGETTESCLEYNALRLRTSLVVVAILPKMLSLLFFFSSWWQFRSVEGSDGPSQRQRDFAAISPSSRPVLVPEITTRAASVSLEHGTAI